MPLFSAAFFLFQEYDTPCPLSRDESIFVGLKIVSSAIISGQRLLLFALCDSTFLLDIPFRMCYFRVRELVISNHQETLFVSFFYA